jgi:hypothetical protein
VNDELESIYKKAIIAKFKVLCRHLPGEAEENQEKLFHHSGSPGRDLNSGPSKYEAGVLTTRL